jgi:hypothetical protein
MSHTPTLNIYLFEGPILCQPKHFGRHCLSIQKKNCNPNKLPQFKKMSSLPWCIITIIHVGFLEYLSFKQFKLIVKMTRIESEVTIP